MELENNSETTVTEEVTETSTKAETSATESKDQPAFDDFDWGVDKRNRTSYATDKAEAMEKEFEATFRTLQDDEIVLGTVVGITDSDVVMNVGYKSDGLIPRTEFRDIEDLKVGMEIDVYVVSRKTPKATWSCLARMPR